MEVSPSERAMLGYFLAKLHRVDPDIIVGHNLTSFAFEVLQHRMAACQVPQWSRIGRLKRKDMPKVREEEERGEREGWSCPCCHGDVYCVFVCAGEDDRTASVCWTSCCGCQDISKGAD